MKSKMKVIEYSPEHEERFKMHLFFEILNGEDCHRYATLYSNMKRAELGGSIELIDLVSCLVSIASEYIEKRPHDYHGKVVEYGHYVDFIELLGHRLFMFINNAEMTDENTWSLGTVEIQAVTHRVLNEMAKTIDDKRKKEREEEREKEERELQAAILRKGAEK